MKNYKLFLLQLVTLFVICTLYNDLILGFVWIILHEAVHVVISKKFNIRTYDFTINITGVSAQINNIDDLNERNKIKVLLSGPLFNFICFIIFLYFSYKYKTAFLYECMTINLGLFVFNMLPAYPLDGVRIYEILLNKKVLFKKAKQYLIHSSFFVVAILLGLFIYTVYIHMANYSLLLAAVLISYSSVLEMKNTTYVIMGNLIRKRRRLIREGYIENKSISVYYKKDIVKVLSLLDRNRFNTFFVIDDELNLLGIIHEDEVINVLKEKGNMTLEEYLNKYKN